MFMIIYTLIFTCPTPMIH